LYRHLPFYLYLQFLALAGVFLKEAISGFQIIAIAIVLLRIHIMYTGEKKIEVKY
jgi:hypothetical protein